MNTLPIEALGSSELSFASNTSHIPFVVRKEAIISGYDANNVFSFFTKHADLIRHLVKHNGVLLFRDLPLTQAQEYEHALVLLGYDLYESNTGGASPRSKVTDKTFVSTEAPPAFIIGLHTEFCYQTTRPGMISFFCLQPGKKYGETPIFDCAKVWDSLSEKLKEKLEANGLLYKRFFPGKKSILNFRKTWQETFQTQDRSTVEAFLMSEGMDFTWQADGGLATELRVPAVMIDQAQGKKRLSITMFNAESFKYNFRYFRRRYNTLLRIALEWFVTHEYGRQDTFLQVALGDGSPFLKSESEEIQRAAWNNAIAFKWRAGDLLILDNISYAHSRLNVQKPREIIAAMADPYDVREYAGEGKCI